MFDDLRGSAGMSYGYGVRYIPDTHTLHSADRVRRPQTKGAIAKNTLAWKFTMYPDLPPDLMGGQPARQRPPTPWPTPPPPNGRPASARRCGKRPTRFRRAPMWAPCYRCRRRRLRHRRQSPRRGGRKRRDTAVTALYGGVGRRSKGDSHGLLSSAPRLPKADVGRRVWRCHHWTRGRPQ